MAESCASEGSKTLKQSWGILLSFTPHGQMALALASRRALATVQHVSPQGRFSLLSVPLRSLSSWRRTDKLMLAPCTVRLMNLARAFGLMHWGFLPQD